MNPGPNLAARIRVWRTRMHRRTHGANPRAMIRVGGTVRIPGGMPIPLLSGTQIITIIPLPSPHPAGTLIRVARTTPGVPTTRANPAGGILSPILTHGLRTISPTPTPRNLPDGEIIRAVPTPGLQTVITIITLTQTPLLAGTTTRAAITTPQASKILLEATKVISPRAGTMKTAT